MRTLSEVKISKAMLYVEKPDKLTTFGRTKLTTSKLLFF
jgi:hypothetical protein